MASQAALRSDASKLSTGRGRSDAPSASCCYWSSFSVASRVAPGKLFRVTSHLGKPSIIIFRLWRKEALRGREKVQRQRHKKKHQPSATILDSQSIKKSEGGLACSFDVGKKFTDRKRHVLEDTLGLLNFYFSWSWAVWQLWYPYLWKVLCSHERSGSGVNHA